MDDAVEAQIVELVRSVGIQDGLANLAEAGIDQLIQEGFLRDVPILGTVLATIRATGAVRDLLLAKKLGLFLRALQSVPSADRDVFYESLKDSDERHKIGEALLLLLDRLDDMQKPELIGRIFRAYMRGEVDRGTFHLMATAIDRLFMPYLISLISFYSGPQPVVQLSHDVYQTLAFAGLVRVNARGDGGGMLGPEFAGATIYYDRNDLGKILVKILSSDA